MRQPQRDAGQGRRLDALATDGGGIDVRELTDSEVGQVDRCLPLHRLEGAQTYLIAWDGDEPVGHAHIAWDDTKLGIPEVQDVYVLPEQRRRGVASALTLGAERLAGQRGRRRISLSYGIANHAARQLYKKLGYRDAGVPAERVEGTIVVRGEPLAVDDTLVYLVKDVDPDASSSS